MAETASHSPDTTVTEQIEPSTSSAATQSRNEQVVLRLKLKPKRKKKVEWTNETVDNEHMNKKKSKCCCIYEKPHRFGESSSDTDDECEHCHGHKEIKS